MTPTDDPIREAAWNNACWCNATCRAHGDPGEFHESHWVHPGAVPPYTSKLITLAGEDHATAQLAAIESLIRAEPESGFSVKDSFCSLDLEPLGFHLLFEANWIRYPADVVPKPDPTEQLSWFVVRDASELLAWEQAWRGEPSNNLTQGLTRVFPPSLLTEPGVCFLAGRRDEAVLASAILNRTGDVTGLSNVSSGAGDVGPLFPGCARLALALYPATPIVGYERGDDLIAAERAGFTRMRKLRVWQRTPPKPRQPGDVAPGSPVAIHPVIPRPEPTESLALA